MLSVMCAILGCIAQVRLLAAVLCGSPAIVFHFRCLLLVGFGYGFCGGEINQRIRADAG